MRVGVGTKVAIAWATAATIAAGGLGYMYLQEGSASEPVTKTRVIKLKDESNSTSTTSKTSAVREDALVALQQKQHDAIILKNAKQFAKLSYTYYKDLDKKRTDYLKVTTLGQTERIIPANMSDEEKENNTFSPYTTQWRLLEGYVLPGTGTNRKVMVRFTFTLAVDTEHEVHDVAYLCEMKGTKVNTFRQYTGEEEKYVPGQTADQ